MATAFNPTGKTFQERLSAFLSDAKTTHGLTIRVDNGRTAEWQHLHHVAHMFLYNAYKTTKPLKADSIRRTIAGTILPTQSSSGTSSKPMTS